MPEESRQLSDLQKNILKEIVDGSIGVISYHHPERKLGKIANDYEDTMGALYFLEHNFRIVELIPKKILFFDVSEYRVNLEKARELYNSTKPEPPEEK